MSIKKLIKNILIFSIALALAFVFILSLVLNKPNKLPIVAIANYGPHVSLTASIEGVKEALAEQGFIENKTVRYQIADVGFDASLIPQMIAKLKNKSPKVMVVMTTPVAQFAKGAIKDIPLIYNVITDPVEAGLIKQKNRSNKNMTGSSDRQDLKIVLDFSKKLLPHAKRVGLLYATAESNDIALVKMMREAAKLSGLEVLAIPIDQARDIPIRMQHFKKRGQEVDFIYVGTSGPIQPTLPVIASEANKMGIPIVNVEEGAVKEGLVLASFGVNYKQVGKHAGMLVSKVLKGVDMEQLTPLYPTAKDHHGLISRQKSENLGLSLPKDLTNIEILERDHAEIK